jgi:hypothetical protein
VPAEMDESKGLCAQAAKRDVKNEGRTDYVHENTENDDKMSCE